jgi:hypothetical protein
MTKKLYLVKAVSSFIHSYAIRAESREAAEEAVNLDSVEEFAQRHFGHNTVSSREVTEAEYLRVFDDESPYLKSWSTDKKMACIEELPGLEESETEE